MAGEKNDRHDIALNGNDMTNEDESLISSLSCCNKNFHAVLNCINNSIATNERFTTHFHLISSFKLLFFFLVKVIHWLHDTLNLNRTKMLQTTIILKMI
jgi:hypothetical protein